jgi:hypothetical protein|nr:MAG TPA: hypothetical protein [Herelleviridae sp.]
MKPKLFETVENTLIDALNGHDLHGKYAGIDFAYEVYQDIYDDKQKAEEDLAEIGTFLAIEAVLENREAEYGSSNGEFGNPCWVADELVYILGEKLIEHVFGDDEDFREASEITPEIAQRFSIMLDEALAETPDLVEQLWKDL